ncbi:MAG TPA: hypothetical protein VHI93_07705, partial [Candidatus Thermoplasmatota archaeon]|nr:hypothetical protein [Candidatus Thermoplasmatota archaeon]
MGGVTTLLLCLGSIVLAATTGPAGLTTLMGDPPAPGGRLVLHVAASGFLPDWDKAQVEVRSLDGTLLANETVTRFRPLTLDPAPTSALRLAVHAENRTWLRQVYVPPRPEA